MASGCSLRNTGAGDEAGPSGSRIKRERSTPEDCTPNKVPRQEKVERLATPILPPNEKPEKFRLIRLPNGIKALLISSAIKTAKTESSNGEANWSAKFPVFNANLCEGVEIFDKRLGERSRNNLPGLMKTIAKVKDLAPPEYQQLAAQRRRPWSPSVLFGKGKFTPARGPDWFQQRFYGSSPIPRGIFPTSQAFADCRGPAHGHGCGSAAPILFTVTVHAGSHSDPEDYQGIAHLVEHLVHFGSQKYEGEISFLNFLNEKGGYFNAFTAPDVTNYHCALNNSSEGALNEICERYALMLSSPLFNTDFVGKELESVDTEHFMRRVNHYLQGFQLIGDTTIDGSHPLKNYGCGTKDTLLAVGSNPEEALKLLKSAAHRFIETNYYGNNMSIVLQGPYSLDVLEKVVAGNFHVFSPWSKYAKPQPFPPLPYNMAKFNRLYTIRPQRSEKHELILQWALDPIVRCYKHKGTEYVANLIKSEHPTGLTHYLRTNGWITDITVYVDLLRGYPYVTDFMIYFALTKRGRDNLREVIAATFAFLQLHQKTGALQANFDEMKNIDKYLFENMEMDTTIWGMVNLSVGLFQYETQDIVIGPSFISSTFHKDSVNFVLQSLSPATANYMLFSVDTPHPASRSCSLLGTIFHVEDFCCSNTNRVSLKSFQYPRPIRSFNPRIPRNPFLIPALPLPNEGRNIVQFGCTTRSCNIYNPLFKMTSQQGFYDCTVFSGKSDDDDEDDEDCDSDSMMQVWSMMLNMVLSPKIAHQTALGAWVSFYSADCLMEMIAVGLKSGLHEAAMALIETFNGELDERNFNSVKEAILCELYSHAASSSVLGWDYLIKLKFQDYNTYAERYEKLEKITFRDLKKYVDSYKRCMKFFTIVFGSVTREQENHFTSTLKAIRCQRILPKPCSKKKTTHEVTEVAPGVKCLRLNSQLTTEKVLHVMNYYEAEVFTEENFKTAIFIAKGIREIIFSELRTKEQLGYHVGSTMIEADEKIGLILFVGRHMDKHCPDYIDRRMDNLLSTFGKGLEAYVEKEKNRFRLPASMVRQFFEKFFRPGSTSMCKLTVQIDTSKRNELENLCKSNVVIPLCKKYYWGPPIHQLGFKKEKMSLAVGALPDDSLSIMDQVAPNSYFIGNIANYHNS